MTSLALALAYLGTLAFVAGLLARRGEAEAWRTEVRRSLQALRDRVSEHDARAPAWDHAANYVEAQDIAKGLRR